MILGWFLYPSWCILMILGWFLYFFIANSTGSLSYTLVFVCNVLSISRLSIAEIKYLLKISAHLVGFLMISSSSESKIFPFLAICQKKMVLLVSKTFIICYKFRIKIFIKVFLDSSQKRYTEVSLFFISLSSFYCFKFQ